MRALVVLIVALGLTAMTLFSTSALADPTPVELAHAAKIAAELNSDFLKHGLTQSVQTQLPGFRLVKGKIRGEDDTGFDAVALYSADRKTLIVAFGTPEATSKQQWIEVSHKRRMRSLIRDADRFYRSVVKDLRKALKLEVSVPRCAKWGMCLGTASDPNEECPDEVDVFFAGDGLAGFLVQVLSAKHQIPGMTFNSVAAGGFLSGEAPELLTKDLPITNWVRTDDEALSFLEGTLFPGKLERLKAGISHLPSIQKAVQEFADRENERLETEMADMVEKLVRARRNLENARQQIQDGMRKREEDAAPRNAVLHVTGLIAGPLIDASCKSVMVTEDFLHACESEAEVDRLKAEAKAANDGLERAVANHSAIYVGGRSMFEPKLNTDYLINQIAQRGEPLLPSSLDLVIEELHTLGIGSL